MEKIYSVTFCDDGEVKVEKLFLNADDARKYLDKRFDEELTKAKSWCEEINDVESIVVHGDNPTYKSVEYSANWFSFNVDELDYPF